MTKRNAENVCTKCHAVRAMPTADYCADCYTEWAEGLHRRFAQRQVPDDDSKVSDDGYTDAEYDEADRRGRELGDRIRSAHNGRDTDA